MSMTHRLLHPQPLGIFPLPAGYLVIPAVDGGADLCASLLTGRVPDAMPDPLRFYAQALAGDADGAWQALERDPSPEACYNRFVLRSEPSDYARLRSELDGELHALLDLVAYTTGMIDRPPEPVGCSGEVAACILAAHAAHALETDQREVACAMLQQAVAEVRDISPLFAAQLLGDLAEMQVLDDDADAAIRSLHDALDLIGLYSLPDVRAHLALRLGMLYQERAEGRRAMLLEASKCYQEALRFYTRETAPELYALAQNNLALVYLAMPLTEASDQLRKGIAVQALREALTIYTRDTHPDLWRRTQLNLANALQYLPSANLRDHLIEAVGLYDDLLATRDLRHDPAGYARVLANQGNALAHLGDFARARQQLSEARRLFAVCQDADAIAGVDEVLEEIARQEAGSRKGEATAPALRRAPAGENGY
ncbi:Tetratricopeptide TPR_4 [Roseiflexus castenholzii DSM 13941]|uniref:Tetratricopeptide TPR_4 n=2 Tax=Roseiflexus castenholzii TaxID=120962 RepID=A7NQJ4_ROSCS|nr:Tetratricopeptide TPR_4 [Roseiflexus castenholzii DSM 13941]